MKKIMTKKNFFKYGTGTALLASAGAASADVAADITAAFTTGGTRLGLAVAGIITMVTVVTGIGLVISMLRK